MNTVNFYPKTYLILYPSLENATTGIAIHEKKSWILCNIIDGPQCITWANFHILSFKTILFFLRSKSKVEMSSDLVRIRKWGWCEHLMLTTRTSLKLLKKRRRAVSLCTRLLETTKVFLNLSVLHTVGMYISHIWEH